MARESCHAPRCKTLVRGGRKWCAKHQAILDRVRAELEGPPRLWGPAQKPRKRTRYCRVLDCTDLAKPGRAFCPFHLRLRGDE